MKPKKLRLKNFGPFIDETIDFAKLTEAPLFLITGKTGAGKTTLFDGMTYALFGETSGRIRTGKEMRSLFATPEEETCVFFSFEHQRLNYEIERKPEQFLAKRKGEGNRKQAAKVSLTIFDEAGKEMRQYTKRSEVDQLIKELMNLDAKQFSQIVLLPQGEFRNFLISSSSEKEIVLRNLFGTQFFQQLNEQLKEKAKEHQKNLDHLEQELSLLQKRFIPLDTGTVPETLSFDALFTYWQAEQTTLQERLLQEKNKLVHLQEQQKQLEDTYYHSQTLQTRQEEKQKLEQKHAELIQQESEINEIKQWITHYEFAERLVDTLTRSQEYQKEQAELIDKEQTCSETFVQQEQAYAQWHKDEPERKNAQQEMEHAANRLQVMKSLIPIAEEWQKKQNESEELQKAKKKAEEKEQKILQEQVQLKEEEQRLAELLLDQDRLHSDQLCYEQLRHEQEKYQTILTENNQNTEQLKMNQTKLSELITKLQAQQVMLSKQNNQVDLLKSQWASQQIAKLQLLLLPGQPCPVCGSTDHPKQQNEHVLPNQEEFVQLEANLAEAETNLEQINQEIGRSEAEKAQIEQKIADLENFGTEKQVEIQKSKERLQHLIQQSFKFAIADDPLVSLGKIQHDLDSRAEAITQAKIATQTLTERLSLIEDQRKKITEQISQNKEELQQVQGELVTLTKQLEGQNTQTLIEDVNQLEENVAMKAQWLAEEKTKELRFSQEISLLKAQMANIHEQQAKIENKIQRIQEQISAKIKEQAYFKEADEVLAFAKQTVEYQEKSQLVNAYEKERLIVEDRLSQLNHVALAETLPDLEQLEQQLDELKAAVQTQQEHCYHLQEQEQQNQQIIEEFSSIYQASQEQLDELIELQQLSQTMNGENPRKTSLERYVLQVYLQEVLQVANVRLQRLTKNRYQFELADEVGSYRGKTGLEINIYDDEAGLTRGAHTLSGGESFIAALSLALALAEVIQTQAGGVLIEALFIDEGFGSLDEEALEMAIEALETIESEGRMIGIISHVRELKERVVQQIRIETEGSGQSKVRYHLG